MPFGMIGSLVGSGISSAMQSKEAQKNRDFQAMMSNTAYQRQVVDLKAAGLSPMLAYMKGGGGASTPPGSQAQLPDMGDAFSKGMSSAIQYKKLDAELDLIKAQATATRQRGRRDEALGKIAGLGAMTSEEAQKIIRQWFGIGQEGVGSESDLIARHMVSGAQEVSDLLEPGDRSKGGWKNNLKETLKALVEFGIGVPGSGAKSPPSRAGSGPKKAGKPVGKRTGKGSTVKRTEMKQGPKGARPKTTKVKR